MEIEVEIRAKVNNFDDIKKALNKIGANFMKKERQVDRIFGSAKFLDSEHKIIEGGLSARIREVDDKKTLEFKEIVREKGSGIELNSEVSSSELAERMLKKLDFEEAFAIKKSRESYSYNDFTICLDGVEQLGNFVEVEKMVFLEEEKDKAREDCIDLMEKLTPNFEIEKRKYGDLMQELINQKK